MHYPTHPSRRPGPLGTLERLRRPGLLLLAAAAMALVLLACSTEEVVTPETVPAEVSSLEVTSAAFAEGAEIPERFTCDGEDASPPLRWSGGPDRTRGYALIVDDPDAPGGNFVHWVVYGIAAGTTSIAENSVPPGAVQGVNDLGTSFYFGPCPPRGDGPHRYFFTVFALSSPLGLGPNATADQVRSAAKDKTKATGQLKGLFERS